MLKKIIPCLLLTVATTAASAQNKWESSYFAEKGKFNYFSSVTAGENKLAYVCSVFKFNTNMFGKSENILLDLDLKLEEDKLAFQEEYKVSLIFSNGKLFQYKLGLSPNIERKDRFNLFLSQNDSNDRQIINNLLQRSYVNVEVEDNNKKRVLYRFYLKDSMKAIKETQTSCNLLHDTFK